MKYFLRSLLIGLLCLAPLSTDATQRVAALISPQAINVDLGFVQVGNVGNLSVMGAPSGATFSLLTNPGGHFSIVGTEIVADDSTPGGQYSIQVQATGTGFSVNKTFVLNFAGAILPPVPGVFSVGINLVGAEAPFPSFATTAQINYHANRLHGSLNPVPKFRFTLGWSKVNPLGQTVGIQPTAFGALDTTSTLYGGTSYVGAMNNVISTVMAAGGQVLLDIHEFGNAPGATTVGSAGCPFSCFGDLWGKIANYYVHTRPDLLAGIYGLDLMNEWKFIDSAIAFNANQAAITAIRANGYTGPIYIEGVNFTSAWNWTSGQGQSFNNSNLYQLVDPLNNLISSAHMYPDPDDSGSLGAQTFAYNVAVATAGSAPTGLNVNPTIAVTRTSREWQPWLALHGLRGHLGEYGSSTDNPWISGLFDYADWNTITSNLLTYLQANNIEISIWASGNGGAGYGQNGYGYSLDPFNANLTGATDFTSTGIQAPVWTVIDNFTGHTGAQPTAYALFQPGLSTPNLYTTVGTPSAPFSIYYGGKITSSTVITPHDTLLDGTSGGGTFTPATITLANGDNGLATFTYTPSQAATFKISTTNNRGWTDPPFIGFSSQGATDPYAGLNYVALSNMYGLYDRFTPNTGPSLKLQRVSDNQQLDWGFTLLGNGFAQFDRGAIQTWASARAGIPVTTIHSIGPIANDITCTGSNLPTLNLQNSAGYPEIVVPAGAACEFNIPIPGATALSTIARMNQSVGGAFFRQDWFTGPIILLNGGFQIFSTGCLPNGTVGGVGQGVVNSTLSLGVVNGAYHDYGASYASGVTNGFQTYKDGTQVAQATVTYQLATCFASTQIEFAHFKNGPQPWSGSFTNFELVPGINYTPTQQAAIAAMDATYYSTPLPDTLPALNPVISGTGANSVVAGLSSSPFSGITIADANTGTPTDSVTITGSGTAGGTLTGTGLTGTGPWTMSAAVPGTITSQMRALVYIPAGAIATTETFTVAVTSSAGTSASDNHTVTTVIAPFNPVIVGTGATAVITGKTSTPFHNVTIGDSNPGTPTDSLTITLTGSAGGTLSGTGLSGSGPYSLASAVLGTLTARLRALTYTPSGAAGTTETFAIAVTSSTGTSASDSGSVATVQNIAAQQAAFPAPVGTFTPVNFKGTNITDAAQGYPAAAAPSGSCTAFPGNFCSFGYIYPQNIEVDYWASAGFGAIRMAVIALRLQPQTYGPLDPVGRTDEAPNAYRNFGAGTQTNLLAIKAVLDEAFIKNMYVIIDLHNGGGMVDTQNGNAFITCGNGAQFTNIFIDWWVRIATVFKNYPNVVWGLLNEPVGCAVSGTQAAQAAATTAIAAVTTQQIILWQGGGDAANNWFSQGNDVAWGGYVPPAGITGYMEMHQYLNAANDGFTADVVSGKGASVLSSVTTWCASQVFKCFLGEVGWAASNAIISPGTGVPGTEGDAIINSMHAAPASWIGWTFWLGGSNVFENTWATSITTTPYHPVFSNVPVGYPTGPFTDAPQTTILKTYNFLLERDVDPSSNDNSPMFLEKAA